jgi:hypothetical protein
MWALIEQIPEYSSTTSQVSEQQCDASTHLVTYAVYKFVTRGFLGRLGKNALYFCLPKVILALVYYCPLSPLSPGFEDIYRHCFVNLTKISAISLRIVAGLGNCSQRLSL